MLALSIAARRPLQEGLAGSAGGVDRSARGATRPAHNMFAVPFSQRRRPWSGETGRSSNAH